MSPRVAGPAAWRRLLAPSELRAVAAMAGPAVVVQVALMMMGVVDVLMAGRISAPALAAVALGNLYVFCTLIFGMGTLLVLDPIVAQGVGAGDSTAVTRGFQRGVLIAAGLTVVVALALVPAEPVLAWLRQPADVVPTAAAYVRASIPGVLPFYLFIIFRQTLQAFGRMAPIVAVVLAANVVNALLNWVLMFGHLGARPLGAVGSAWSTTIGRWAMAVGLLAAGWRELRPQLRRLDPDVLRPGPLARTLRLGIPIGLQQSLEVGAFAAVMLLVGLFGSTPLAGHEIAINLASLTFMVPLGVATAAATLVGHAVGAADLTRARVHAAASLLYGVGFMTLSAAAFILAPHAIAAAYTRDPAVLAVAGALLPIAGVFQVFDGTQAVASGVLRGTGDTRVPLLANLVGFWGVGLPMGAALAFASGVGPAGLWWGMVAGLALVAVLLSLRVRARLGGAVRRVEIDRADPARVPVG